MLGVREEVGAECVLSAMVALIEGEEAKGEKDAAQGGGHPSLRQQK